MIIERWLNPEQLKRYRAWKMDVRVTLKLWRQLLSQVVADRSLRRLFDSRYSPIFLCGVSGSGTTLIGGLLDQNYQNELCIHVSDRNKATNRLLFMEKSYWYDSLDEYYRDMFLPWWVTPTVLRQLVLSLYRRLTEYPRSSGVVLDKAPNSHLVRIAKLRKAFPNSKILLIYRDPKEVIEGLKRKWPVPFGKASVDELCEFWNSMHEIFLAAAQDFEEDLFVISYAALVRDPDGWEKQIADFCGLRPRSELLGYDERRNKPGKGLRNVVDGKIEVIKNAFDQVTPSIDAAGMLRVELLTAGTFDKLARLDRALTREDVAQAEAVAPH